MHGSASSRTPIGREHAKRRIVGRQARRRRTGPAGAVVIPMLDRPRAEAPPQRRVDGRVGGVRAARSEPRGEILLERDRRPCDLPQPPGEPRELAAQERPFAAAGRVAVVTLDVSTRPPRVRIAPGRRLRSERFALEQPRVPLRPERAAGQVVTKRQRRGQLSLRWLAWSTNARKRLARGVKEGPQFLSGRLVGGEREGDCDGHAASASGSCGLLSRRVAHWAAASSTPSAVPASIQSASSASTSAAASVGVTTGGLRPGSGSASA